MGWRKETVVTHTCDGCGRSVSSTHYYGPKNNRPNQEMPETFGSIQFYDIQSDLRGDPMFCSTECFADAITKKAKEAFPDMFKRLDEQTARTTAATEPADMRTDPLRVDPNVTAIPGGDND